MSLYFKATIKNGRAYIEHEMDNEMKCEDFALTSFRPALMIIIKILCSLWSAGEKQMNVKVKIGGTTID